MIKPERDVFNGDHPPYQWPLSMGWRRYADNLPSAPAGTTLHGPPYPGTPGTTLSLTKIDSNEMQRAVENYSNRLILIEEHSPAMVLCPDAISVNPGVFNDLPAGPAEIKSALSWQGLDPNMGNPETRLRGVLDHDHNGQSPILVIEE